MKTRKPRKYHCLPKKYQKMLYNNPFSERCTHVSKPVKNSGYIYYIFTTNWSGHSNYVYRFTEEEYNELFFKV